VGALLHREPELNKTIAVLFIAAGLCAPAATPVMAQSADFGTCFALMLSDPARHSELCSSAREFDSFVDPVMGDGDTPESSPCPVVYNLKGLKHGDRLLVAISDCRD
jgi:hypothetical protein